MNLVKPKSVLRDGIIVDLLSPESYDSEHIRGARNFCVYELAFGEKVSKAFPDKETVFFIYGLNNKTLEAARADFMLRRLGYVNVNIIDGGIEAWRASRLPIVSKKIESRLNGRFNILPKQSRLEWVGRNIGNKHVGDVKVVDGFVVFKKGVPVSGEISVDMKTIYNFDQEGDWKTMLMNHLKSSDFFDVEKYPFAKIVLVTIERLKDIASKPNFMVTSDLTIKGKTNRIRFKAYVREKLENAVVTAHLDLDRSKWGVIYGSEKFFSRLGIHAVDDIVSFDLIVFFEKAK